MADQNNAGATMDQGEDTWILQTDPDKTIELGTYLGYRLPTIFPMVTSYRELFEMMSAPEEGQHKKDGRGYVIGPCSDTRKASNIACANVCVIDADSSLNEKSEIVMGAPNPLLVHTALTNWDISHHIHTTFSHGSEKGNRYRVIFPVHLQDKSELAAFLEYIVTLLQTEADLPIALSKESCVWGQGWTFPRVPYQGSEFYSSTHWGGVPNPRVLVERYQGRKELGRAPSDKRHSLDELEAAFSPASLVAKYLPIQHQLEKHGYAFVSQSVMLDSNGKEVPALRYRKPGSTSAPGVVLFNTDAGWKVYSHHSNDVLNNGHSNDAADVYALLNGFGDDLGAALRHCVPTIQEAVEEELNEKFPSVLEHGSKFRFGNTYVDDMGALTFRFVDVDTFMLSSENQPGVPTLITNSDGSKSLMMAKRGPYWRSCRRRILYNGTTYEPCKLTSRPRLSIIKAGKPYFNLFRDWYIRPKKGSWDLLEWHLRNSICGGNEDEYEYLLNWFSHLFQYPELKPQVAIVLKGGRGWGKTILFSALAKKLGIHAFVAGNNRLLTGNFNSHLRNKLLLVAEESYWSGNHKERGVLQHLISDEVTGYEKKGVDAEAGRSFLRVVMISNEQWVAPAASDERRYFIPTLMPYSKDLDIVNGKKGNFFPQLALELHNGGLEAFCWEMANRKFDVESVKNVPNTDCLMEQKEMSLEWMDKFLLHCLSEGVVRSADHGACKWTLAGMLVPKQAFRDAALEYCPPGEASLRAVTGMTTRRIKRVFGDQVRVQSSMGGMAYVFGSLIECRKRFSGYVGFEVAWDTLEEEAVLRGQLDGISSQYIQ